MESTSLYEFQTKALERVLNEPKRRQILNFDTGLGKSAVAVSVGCRIAAGRVLVVTPSVVKQQWLDELAKWWPNHPQAATISFGKARTKGLSKAAKEAKEVAYAAPIKVVSYSLVSNVEVAPWDLIILDECHRLKNPASKQAVAVREIVRHNHDAAVLGLTATLFPDRITDVWHQLDLLWPGRFGEAGRGYRYPSWKFCNRYSVDVGDEYGSEWFGIRSDTKEELQTRLAAVSYRVTKHEVAHLLPPFLVKLAKLEPSGVAFGSVEDWLARQGEEKLSAVLSWVEDAMESASHVCILTHLKETAHTIAENLNRTGAAVIHIDGEMSVEKRNEALAHARGLPKAIVVATMHSVGIGINLGFATEALFAELYYRPETIIQALGRFDGFRTRAPTTATILCLRGTIDERMAESLQEKIGAYSQAVKAGVSDEKFLFSLSDLKMSDADVIASLNAALGNTSGGYV